LNDKRPMPLLDWPTATPATMYGLLAALLLLLLAVALWEIYRRRTERAARIRAEWRVLNEIAKEKGLSPEEKRLFDAVIQRHSASEPLRAITVRQHFDECIEQEMADTYARSDVANFEQLGQTLRDVRLHLGLDFVPFGQRITSTRGLNAGQVIWMARAGNASAEWSRVSVVEVDEAMFRVVPPNDSTTATKPSLSAGDTVTCRMWRDEDARYMFEVTVARIEKSPAGWVLRHTSQMNRTQARADYRVQHDQATTVGVLDGPVDGNTTSVKERRVVTRLRGRINSLSAGGLALLTHQAVPKQVLLRIRLDLPGYDVFEAEARIVSTSAVSGGRWLVRVSFVNLDQDKRDSVAHYVLHRQQPLLRVESKAE